MKYGRLIDADALIKRIVDTSRTPIPGWLRAEIISAPTIEPEPKWIPCGEGLPKEAEASYWVCTDGGYQCQCRWTNDVFGLGEGDTWTWKIFDIPQYSKVIAWMPLPEPWREEEDEHTMEEFMYGQDMGNPDDGSL